MHSKRGLILKSLSKSRDSLDGIALLSFKCKFVKMSRNLFLGIPLVMPGEKCMQAPVVAKGWQLVYPHMAKRIPRNDFISFSFALSHPVYVQYTDWSGWPSVRTCCLPKWDWRNQGGSCMLNPYLSGCSVKKPSYVNESSPLLLLLSLKLLVYARCIMILQNPS